MPATLSVRGVVYSGITGFRANSDFFLRKWNFSDFLRKSLS
jgi:hypothetical protein